MNNIKVETHCHTHYSRDCLMDPKRLIEIAHQKGIDRLCVTDHNDTRGALEMAMIEPELIIPGVEIMTTKGELLVLFIQHEIPSHLDPLNTIELCKKQGAIVIVPHPFDRLRKGFWTKQDLHVIAPYVDAIEVFNSRCMASSMNELAYRFARSYEMLSTVGSDAHTYYEVGRSTILMNTYESPNDFLVNLVDARFDTNTSTPLVRLVSRWAVLSRIFTW
jgi:predicted metal-dependent phosphoesterase TrpH